VCSSGSARSSSIGPASDIWARARRSALSTAAVVVSSICATSAVRNASTSRNVSTARCRAGRNWSAATKARRTPAFPATIVAGSSAAEPLNSASGAGWSHGTDCSPDATATR
jgi:hypothetical protein